MTTYVLRRILLFVPTLWVIATLSFFIVRLAPGGPFQSEKEIPAAARAQLMRTYGLDRPLPEQYVRFLANAARGDFGVSYRYPQRQVREIVSAGFRVSAELGGWALLLAVLAGVPLGVLAAVKRNRLADHAVMGLALAGVSVPNFVLAPLLVLIFALTLYWLPPALWNGPASRVLPVIALSLMYVAFIARLARAGMLEVLGQDFVRTARAKGLAEPAVIARHALPLGVLPVVSFLGPAAARVVMGSIVIEQVFAIPGLGRQLVGAAFNRDYTLVLGIVLFYAALLLVLNLLVDLAYAKLDPRVELS
ncbi:MAG: ABC transporter permease [Candidatus Eisenbacteria bacterium]|nr:ABC transporter permease [Candidatus Eisenbacteria bacterium]